MATVEQIAIIKMNPNVPVRALAERVGLSKSQVHTLRTQVVGISADGGMVVITKRVAA
jgi:hypothetical protein